MSIKRIFLLLFILLSMPFIIGATEEIPNDAEKAQELQQYYGTSLCDKPGFKCLTLKRGDSWTTLFPDETERDLVQRLNRLDTPIGAGREIVVPTDLKNTTLFDVAPFPLKIKEPKEKLVIVDQHKLAWGAFDAAGNLVKWGPISSGKDYCPDVHRPCKTLTGIFHVFHKKGQSCRSNIFPVDEGGGSPMPYCMFFFKGFALHGSNEVVGRRESHGCVRLFTRDAIWLNEQFVDAATKEGYAGTRVIIQKLVTETQ